MVIVVRLHCTLLRTSPTPGAGMFMVEWEEILLEMEVLEWLTSIILVSKMLSMGSVGWLQ